MHIKKCLQNRGFSLVELLVGMGMGVIVLLIILQALSVAEGYKRTATSGSDAQVNGLLALRALESEIRMAGYGMMNSASLCPSTNTYYGSGTTTSTSMPVKIVDGGTGADSIEVVYSSSVTGAAPSRIVVAMPTPSNVTKVSSLAGFKTCDFVLFAAKDGSKTCSMLQVTGMEPNNVQFQTGSGQSNYNPSGGEQKTFFPSGGYSASDVIINMGSFVDKRFSVNKTASKDEYFLRQTKVNAADDGCNPVDPNPDLDIISNIVNLQTQYGVAPASSQQVNCWTSAAATDTGCSITASRNWSDPPAADVQRIKAIRVAIVVRSALSERPSSTGGSCDTTTAAPTSWNGGPTINLSSIPNWQCYRYKVYQTVVPIINVIWANT
ncbi:MAG: PilW family protein [Burkholderiaceae bacterium]